MAKRPSVTEQAKRLTNGQINRRRFIMSAVASGVTLPTATALASKAEAKVPQRGGTLRIGTAHDPKKYLEGALRFYDINEAQVDAVSLTRRKDHSDPSAGHFDAIEIREISDAVSRHRAIMLGEVDFADGIDPQAVATLKGLGTLSILETESDRFLAGPMRTDVAPFDRPEVRDALAAAIDGDALLRTSAMGHGRVVAPSVQTAGSPPSSEILLHFSEETILGSRAIARLIQKQATHYGLNVLLVDVSAADWPSLRNTVGWHLTSGEGLPTDTAIPHIRMSDLAVHVNTLRRPEPVESNPQFDAFDITSRWWFETEA